MHRAALRRTVTAFAIVVVVSGSVTAQAAETQPAGRVPSTSAAPTIPKHTCTATRCLITKPQHVAGGWPDPTLPLAAWPLTARRTWLQATEHPRRGNRIQAPEHGAPSRSGQPTH